MRKSFAGFLFMLAALSLSIPAQAQPTQSQEPAPFEIGFGDSPQNTPADASPAGTADEASLLYNEAVNALARGDRNTARELFVSVIDRHPNHPRAQDAARTLASMMQSQTAPSTPSPAPTPTPPASAVVPEAANRQATISPEAAAELEDIDALSFSTSAVYWTSASLGIAGVVFAGPLFIATIFGGGALEMLAIGAALGGLGLVFLVPAIIMDIASGARRSAWRERYLRTGQSAFFERHGFNHDPSPASVYSYTYSF